MYDEITKARTLAKIAHAGMKYGVHDYFEYHVMAVATRVLNDPDTMFGHMPVAYLHDVVEDTDVTIEDLKNMGFSEGTLIAVDLITRKDGVTYFDYIRNIAANRNSFAWTVKYHDLLENYTNTKIDGEPSKIARYEKALKIMEKEL